MAKLCSLRRLIRVLGVGIIFAAGMLAGASPAWAQTTISGRITQAANPALGVAGIQVQLSTTTGSLVTTSGANTDSTGNYTIPNVSAGNYRLKTFGTGPFINQIYGTPSFFSCTGFCDTGSTGSTLTVASTPVTVNFSLASGGVISGRIFDASTGAGLQVTGGGASTGVQVYDSTGLFKTNSLGTDSNGNYTVPALPAGNYIVRTTNAPAGYINKFNDGRICLGNCNTTGGTSLSVPSGQTTTLDFALALGGTITGAITDPAGAGIFNTGVIAYDPATGTQLVTSPPTGTNGVFTLGGLPTGSYVLKTYHNIPVDGSTIPATMIGYTDRVYPNILCQGCDVRTGTAIAVTLGNTVPGINFTVTPGGRIAGNVRNAVTSANVQNVTVSVYNSLGTLISGAFTTTAGNYFSVALPTGNYFVRTTFNNAGLINQLYDNINCFNCSIVSGTPVAVTVGATPQTQPLVRADFALPTGGQITGTVRNAVGGAGLANVNVQAYSPSGSFIASTSTNGSGVYTLGGLAGGSYYVRTSNSQSFVDQVYATPSNQPCLGCQVASLGTLLSVTSPGGTTPGIDFNLNAGGGISGTVTNASGGAPISGVNVQVYSSSNSFVSSSNTNGSGNFTLGGLPTGSYFVRTNSQLGFINVVYDGATGATCLNCNAATTGSPIAVTTGSTTPGINLALTTGKTITGTIKNASTSANLVNIFVAIYSESGQSVGTGSTNPSGVYSVTGLPAGIYYARTSNDFGFINQLWNNTVCLSCSNTAGNPIDLSGAGPSATADFMLAPGARVSGTVTDAGTALPIIGANVSFYAANGAFVSSGTTNNSGAYTTFGGFPSGTYFAQASVSGYVNQLYSAIQCNTSNCSVASGNPIAVVAGTPKSGVDFAMVLGGRVSGTITDNSSVTTPPAGIEAVNVSIYDAVSGSFVRSGTSTAAGTYSVVGLPAGTYVARTSNSVGFIDELYDNTKCATCAANTGQSFAVVAGATTSGINFGLDRGGRISGQVTAVAGGAAIPFVNISVYDGQNRFVTSTSTNQNGIYNTSGMAPGNYFVRTTFNSAGYTNQLYAGLPCFSCNASTGTAVSVTGTNTTANINFALSAGGSITGRVTDQASPTPNVLSSISVSVYDSNNSFMGSASTNSLGVFTVLGLPSGTYFARTSNSRGYIDRLHSGIACTSCTVSSGTPIVVTAGAATTGIDFALPVGGAITGTVTDASNINTPIGGVTVQVYAANGQFLQSTSSAANGVYRTTGGLPAGTYFVKTSNSLGFVDELYNDTTCLGCSPSTGAPVTVTNAGTTSGIDFGLVSGGVITGTITAAAGGAPVEGISLSVYTSSGFFVTSGYTNGLGVYKTGGMPAGSYFVRTSNSRGFIDQLFNAKACTNCNPTTGTPVVVATNEATTGINFSLASGGRIRGTVTLDGSTTPVPGMSVQFYSGAGTPVSSGFTDSQGNYVTYSGLPTGTYYARTSNSSGLIDEAFDNVPCTSCSVATTRPIAVTAGADTTGVNFALAGGGRIAGIVTDRATPPAPVANARVQVYSSTGLFVTSILTGNSGRYLTSTGLPAGNYFVKVSAPGGLISALYKTQTVAPHNVNCPSCSVLTGTGVAVTSGATTNDIDFAMSAGGLISGTVLDASTGVPLSGVSINIFDQTNGFVAGASTDALGRYNSGSGMPSGTYFARTGNGQGYINQVFNNTACLNCLPSSGAPITVTVGTTTSGIDFNLVAGGKVSGTVTDVVTGLPIAGASFTVFGSNGKSVGGANTDNAGNFVTGGGLPTGTYFARVSAGDQGYVSQVFANTTCLSCDVTRGTAITVTAGSTTGSINFALVVGGGVAGRVTSTESSAGLANVEVSLFTSQGTFVAKGVTNADGNFGGSGVPPGSYLLRTRNLQGFVDEAFDNVACAPCPMTATTATAISVTARTTTSGINFGLDTGGLVTGIVTNALTGAPLEGVTVSFFQAGVFKGRSLPSDESGFYAISLPVGTYSVVPDALQGYTIGIAPGSRTAAETLVTVTKGVETPSVSFPLSACTPPTVSPSALAIFTAGQPYTQTLTASGGTAPYSFSVSSGSLPPGLTLNAATGVISGTPSVSGTASFSVSASDATGCAGTADFTPFVCGVSVGTSQASYTSAAAAGSLAIAANATDCAWTATSNAPWLTLGGAAGTGSGTLGYTVAANPSPTAFRTGTITVAGNAVTVTQGAAATAAPFGSFDTPNATGTISGSVAVTGWALDDLAVDRVEIWRDRVAGETTPLYPGPGPGTGKIYIATPLFISGARPDVASAFASYPFANRAGWGYLMLTQGLWNQGNGTYTLYAFAFDKENKSTTLGTKTITVDNTNATRPFGGIDAPTYGQTVSGGFWNFGWGLTPGSTCTIVNGSVQVGIDSQPLTPVNYGDLRTDIAAAFPGFTNGGGAGGAYYIDTTTMTDGTHQIGWYVVDNCGRADGVGSRFFTVANGTASDTTPDGAVDAGLEAPKEGQMAARGIARVLDAAVTVQTDGGETIDLPPTADGLRVVQVRQGSRIAVRLPPANGTYTAYQIANGAQVAVPLGSSFDAVTGTFYWEPAAGYLGSYDLAFVAVDGSAIPLRVVVEQ